MRRLAIFFVIFLLCSCTVFAEDIEIAGEDFYNETAGDIVSGQLDLNPVTIINRAKDMVFDEIDGIKPMLKSILLISVVAGILRVLGDSFSGKETGEAAFFVCFAMISVTCVSVFSEAVGYGARVVHGLCEFITKFEPILMGLLLSSGSLTQAAAFQPVLAASVYILGILVDKCILPMTYFSAILGIVNNIGKRVEIGTLNKLLTSVSKWILTGVLTLFSAILTLYGFGTSALNTVAAKGIKFAVGSLVPVVGSLLSDTVETVISGTNLLKNAVGTAGMITVIVMSAVPVIKVWIMMMLLKVTAAFCEPFSDKRITGVLLSVADAVSAVFQMVVTAGMLFIISIGIILISTGVSV